MAPTGRDDWWKQAVEGSIAGIAFCDLDACLTYANPSWVRMFGYAGPHEVLTRHAAEFAECAQDVTDIFAQVLAVGAWSGEVPVCRKNGDPFAVELSGTLLRDAAGTPSGVVATFIDVTQRGRSEPTRQLSDQQCRQLVETALDPIFTCDRESRYLYVNQAAAASLGRQQRDIVGKTVYDLFPPDVAQAFDATVRRVLATGDVVLSENRVELNGRPAWFSNVLQPVRDRQGRIEAVQGIVRDITRLKSAEEALRENEDRLRQAVHIANIGIFEHDHIGGTLHRSAEHREIFGLYDETISDRIFLEADGQPPAFLASVHPDDRESLWTAMKRGLQPATGMLDVEFRYLHPTRGIRWLALRAQTFFEGDGEARRPVRTIGASRDITERKRVLEEREHLLHQLSQAQKMESIGRLAGGVAHDFNNMLTVINGNLELVLDEVGPDRPLHATLTEIRDAGRRSADLTRQLLGFARQQLTAPRVLNLNVSIGRSITMLRRLLREDVRLKWGPAGDLWLVRIDPGQIDQILVNLTVNARDAIDGVGEIAIRTSNTILDAEYCAPRPWAAAGEYVVVEVADDGRGMDEATQARVFEPFFTTKAVGQGTGLGLAMVYGIVKQNGGLIDVESTPGEGTAFRMFLPRFVDDSAAAQAGRPVPAPETGNETILVVEDQPMVLRLTMRMLQSLGYTVLSAGTPEEAIRIADERAGSIQLVVTDMVMPRMNGRDLTAYLRSRHPHLKYLFVSGYAGPLAPRGADVHFLPKPFSQASLATKVREALDGKS